MPDYLKILLKVIFLSLLTIGFTLVQAVITMGFTIADTSARDIDNFWAVDEIIAGSLPIAALVILLYALLASRLLKSFLWLIPLMIILPLYWAFFINKPVFEDRAVAWSTWEPSEVQHHVLLFFLIPGIFLSVIFCRVLKEVMIRHISLVGDARKNN